MAAQADLRPLVEFANNMKRSYPDCVDSFQCVGIAAYTLGDSPTAIAGFEQVSSTCDLIERLQTASFLPGVETQPQSSRC